MALESNISTGFTQEQSRAIHTLNLPIIATAGPGAGKTRVLVQRYLEILQQPNVDLENIVAITFTTKAANEVGERIRQGMDEAIARYSGSLLENIWRERKRRLSSAIITTIHGFCSRLLREYPIEAGIDPRFALLDNYTASLMLNLSTEQAITSLIDKGSYNTLSFVATYGRANLVSILERFYIQLRSLGITIDQAEQTTQNSLRINENYFDCITQVQSLIDQLDQSVGSASTVQEKINIFLQNWKQHRNNIEILPSSECLVDYLKTLHLLRTSIPDARSKSIKEIVYSLRKFLGGKTEGDGELAECFYDVCSKEYLPLIFSSLRSMDFLYSEAKRSVQALDYEDLQLCVRALLIKFPDVQRRASLRYRHFLVDEFQDTNQLQREIIELITKTSESPDKQSLFLVGDRKQSIYNFRGAEVEVFEDSISEILKRGGENIQLNINFRSDVRLIDFFNRFFSQLMKLGTKEEKEYYKVLGFVEFEEGIAHRQKVSENPAVEFILYSAEDEEKISDFENVRDIEARRLAARVKQIIQSSEPIVLNAEKTELRLAKYRDFALLLSAFTQVKSYEQAFQQAGIPYYVVAGRGFYSRPEVSDLLMLLEFLDNQTNEISLAGILRSPLFGISDETLFLLRWEDKISIDSTSKISQLVRPLFEGLLNYKTIKYIQLNQQSLLQNALEILTDLISVRNKLSLSQLIEKAINLTQYDIICAAAEDGAQRLSNLDKLLSQARSFEKNESMMLRDFVEFIRNFRRLDTKEAEAQLDLKLDAVAILTIHKSKGLEWPIVILPDLQHSKKNNNDPFLFDRHRGLGFSIPDESGKIKKTALYNEVCKRLQLREQFESMRQLYVGMTRAQDYLILSGASQKLKTKESVSGKYTWLDWVCKALDIYKTPEETISKTNNFSIKVIGQDWLFSLEESKKIIEENSQTNVVESQIRQRDASFLLAKIDQQLQPLTIETGSSLLHYRHSVTQLVSYLSCPRQFYFAKLLQISDLELGSGNKNLADEAESAEVKTQLSPFLRGKIVHRFCETFLGDAKIENVLDKAFDYIKNTHRNSLETSFDQIDKNTVLTNLLPLAKNYINSSIYHQINNQLQNGINIENLIRSEVEFSLRIEQSTILGTIDKLLLTERTNGVDVHIIDFKTNFFSANHQEQQLELAEKVAIYRIQIQAYALAVWRLIPNVKKLEATLHFLYPNLEYKFPSDQITERTCSRTVAEAIEKILNVNSMESSKFEAKPGARCLNCRFRDLCVDAYIPNK